MTPAVAIAVSGLTAATLKLGASASNLANADDTSRVGASDGYQPLGVAQSPSPGGGVTATTVTLRTPSLIAYDPTSPLSNAQGLIQAPEIDPVAEVTNQLQASRAFAFSLEALRTAEDEQKTLLDVRS